MAVQLGAPMQELGTTADCASLLHAEESLQRRGPEVPQAIAEIIKKPRKESTCTEIRKKPVMMKVKHGQDTLDLSFHFASGHGHETSSLPPPGCCCVKQNWPPCCMAPRSMLQGCRGAALLTEKCLPVHK